MAIIVDKIHSSNLFCQNLSQIHSLVYKFQSLKATNLRIFAKMEKSEFPVLIEHYFLRGKTLSENKAKLDKYYSDSAPSYGMVQKWFTEFRCVRTSILCSIIRWIG